MKSLVQFGILCAAGLMILSLGACGGRETEAKVDDEGEETKAAPPAVVFPVEVGVPVRGEISEYLETNSRIEAAQRVEMTAEGTGIALQVLAEEGDRVEQGDILVELDKEDALAQLQQAEVQVRQQKADYERTKKGYEFGGMPEAELDAARFAYEQGQANLRIQRLQVENLTARAPIDGIIVMRQVQQGQLVTSGQPLFSIVNPDSYELVINPPERELPRLHEGQKALVNIDALPGETFTAFVERINPAADPVSGTIKVTLDFAEQAKAKLREALFARVKLVMETYENALLVPKDTVIEENGRKYVFALRENNPEDIELPESSGGEEPAAAVAEADYVADRVEIEVGLEDSKHFQVLTGLDDSDVIVTVGQNNLRPGAPVRVTSSDAEIMANLHLTPEEALAQAKEKRARDEKPPTERMRIEGPPF